VNAEGVKRQIEGDVFGFEGTQAFDRFGRSILRGILEQVGSGARLLRIDKQAQHFEQTQLIFAASLRFRAHIHSAARVRNLRRLRQACASVPIDSEFELYPQRGAYCVFGASELMILSKRGSPRKGSQ
jgi:hypothetical protein